MLWITADRDSLAGNCPELQGLQVSKMYMLALHKTSELSLGVRLQQINWPSVRTDNKAFLCDTCSLTSAKMLVVRPADFNWKITFIFLFFFYSEMLIHLIFNAGIWKTSLGHFTSSFLVKSIPWLQVVRKEPSLQAHSDSFNHSHFSGMQWSFNYKKTKNGVETLSGPRKRRGKKWDRKFG